MDDKTRRLAEALGEMWAAHDTHLAEIRFRPPGPAPFATVQGSPGGARLAVQKRANLGETVWLALHELKHALDDRASEAECDAWASLWVKTWHAPIAAYAGGDPEPLGELTAALSWAKSQRKASERAARFAQVCKAHGVTRLEQAPGMCAPVIVFSQRATAAKAAGDPEIEALIARLWPGGIADAKMARFIRRCLARRAKYVDLVRDLITKGLLPALAA